MGMNRQKKASELVKNAMEKHRKEKRLSDPNDPDIYSSDCVFFLCVCEGRGV